MLTAEHPTAVGNFGFSGVYVVFEEAWGFRDYWGYYFFEHEANELIERISWRDLKVECISYAQFLLIKGEIEVSGRMA